ncbi:MAG: threonine/serine dehydratase [Qingshengfaniella sp.]
MTDITGIEHAASRLKGAIRVTPLLSAPALDRIAGRRVLIKTESLQHTGSFKYRGAKAAMTAPDLPAGGVLAVSSGNHAQGVARAAAEAGRSAVILMPQDAPAAKIEGTRALGAEVVLYDRYTQDRDQMSRTMAAEWDLHLIHPYDDPQVIAGQGTVGLELAAQAAAEGIHEADVLIPCGGGGLSSGVALALANRAPGLRVRTVEPAGFDDTARSLAAGERLANAPDGRSLCDAILTAQPGQLTFPILSRLAGPGLVISDDQALQAMAAAFAHLRLVLEPGGAAALAAALSGMTGGTGPVIAVASGGNVDPALFCRALTGTYTNGPKD